MHASYADRHFIFLMSFKFHQNPMKYFHLTLRKLSFKILSCPSLQIYYIWSKTHMNTFLWKKKFKEGLVSHSKVSLCTVYCTIFFMIAFLSLRGYCCFLMSFLPSVCSIDLSFYIVLQGGWTAKYIYYSFYKFKKLMAW